MLPCRPSTDVQFVNHTHPFWITAITCARSVTLHRCYGSQRRSRPASGSFRSTSVCCRLRALSSFFSQLEVSMWGLSASPVIAVSLQVQTTSFAFAVLPWGNYSKGVFDIPREGMSALLSGNAAVRAHTTAYPGGPFLILCRRSFSRHPLCFCRRDK